jgi:hypothetical protein
MKLEQLIGQFSAYTEYPNQDTFVISNQECADILKYLKQVPKAGHWMVDTDLGYYVSTCSNCNWRGHGNETLIYKPNYCPNCGCRMESDEE